MFRVINVLIAKQAKARLYTKNVAEEIHVHVVVFCN